MRKAVAVALVLIAGAAVVLWFGNRLNSWVLGGLLGGLASLLLSIPIAWVLFSYFTRQHGEHEQHTQDHSPRVRTDRATHSPGYLPDEIDAEYHDDPYSLDDHFAHGVDGEIYAVIEERYQSPTRSRNSGWLDEEFGRPIPPARQLPPAASSRHATGNTPSRHLPTPYGVRQERTFPATHQSIEYEEDNRGRRTTTRRTGYPGLPGSQQDAFRSRFRSDALRTARLEAVRQYMEENDIFPSQVPIHDENPTASRRRQSFQPSRGNFANDVRPTRPSSRAVPPLYRADRRTIDSLPSFNRSEQDALSAYTDEVEDLYTGTPPRSRRGREPQVEHLLPDSSSGDIQRPLLRRAPYTYEDDEVRQQMSRYTEKPSIRRTSRYLRSRNDEDQMQ